MMGQTTVRARELRREELLTEAVRDHVAQGCQRTDEDAAPPWQVMRTAVRTRWTVALDLLAVRAGLALRWRSTPRDHTTSVLAR